MMKRNLIVLCISLLPAYCLAQNNIFPTNGNVGIGTAAPATKLQVVGDVRVDGNYVIHSPDGNGAGMLRSTGGPVTQNGIELYASRGEGYISFLTNSGELEKLRINSNGNVGIGTSTPTEKLAVNGTIRAKEIKVDSSPWPDYVFEEDYKMTSLTEIEAFIKTNKHLPGIPNQKQVEEEGVNLGEMNRKLLEKVEELTLYLIQEKADREEQAKHYGQRIEDLEGKLRSFAVDKKNEK